MRFDTRCSRDRHCPVFRAPVLFGSSASQYAFQSLCVIHMLGENVEHIQCTRVIAIPLHYSISPHCADCAHMLFRSYIYFPAHYTDKQTQAHILLVSAMFEACAVLWQISQIRFVRIWLESVICACWPSTPRHTAYLQFRLIASSLALWVKRTRHKSMPSHSHPLSSDILGCIRLYV